MQGAGIPASIGGLAAAIVIARAEVPDSAD
jgi:hypothetical protein